MPVLDTPHQFHAPGKGWQIKRLPNLSLTFTDVQMSHTWTHAWTTHTHTHTMQQWKQHKVSRRGQQKELIRLTYHGHERISFICFLLSSTSGDIQTLCHSATLLMCFRSMAFWQCDDKSVGPESRKRMIYQPQIHLYCAGCLKPNFANLLTCSSHRVMCRCLQFVTKFKYREKNHTHTVNKARSVGVATNDYVQHKKIW